MISRIALMAALALTPCRLALAQPAALPTRIGPPATVISAPFEPGAIALYGAQTPGRSGDEVWTRNIEGKLTVRNVTRPTLTPFLPEPSKANGAAVIVAPGGAFLALSMDGEGNDVARALAERGIAAFVLKYRLRPTPADEAEAGRYMIQQIVAAVGDPAGPSKLTYPQATDDALAALALVRRRADEWHVNAERIGMIGFSAGAMTALSTALAGQAMVRPAFIGYVYGPQTAIEVPANAPPLFDAIAFDDPLFPSMGFPIAGAWHQAKRPVELHAYQRGGHGFGLGRAGMTNTLLMDEFSAWLAMQGFFGAQRK